MCLAVAHVQHVRKKIFHFADVAGGISAHLIKLDLLDLKSGKNRYKYSDH